MGIAIALIAVVGIVGLTMLGNVLDEGFGNHASSLKSNELAALTASTTTTAPSSSSGTSSETVGLAASGNTSAAAEDAASGSAGSLGLTLGNGQYLNLDNYPVDLSQSIETAGANGTTNMLLATMESVIRQAIETGVITPEEGNKLKALAKQGHYIADMQAEIQRRVTVEKKSADDIAWEIGFDPSDNDEGEAIVKFNDLLSKAQSGGALRDPVLNHTISTLVHQIINISSGVENASSFSEDDKSLSTFNRNVLSNMDERDKNLGIASPESLADFNASELSHQKSDAICKAGKAGDQCRS